ncbi:MAG: ybaL 1 [Planctomycetaceae bacterium]|nr:ybaL 1 [Planctomycetaceae bacterium]
MHHMDLILTLTGGLAAALTFGYITHRLGLSPIVGYLIAGIAVGPHTPGFVADTAMAEQLAEIGVILLMFGVGLHFHLEELLAVRRVAIPGAIGQSLIATALGAIVGVAFHWRWDAGLVFGLAISVASTVVLLRILSENRDLHTPTGHIAIGWLVVEDLFTVVVLVLLPPMFGDDQVGIAGLPLVLGLTALKIAILVGFTLVVGGRIIPWILEKIAATRSRELFTLTVLVSALGIAVGSAKLFGVSMALGAFLAGMVVGRSEFSLRAASEALPMRDAFAVLFFVSVGMLFNPQTALQTPGLVAAACSVILLGKPAAAVGIVLFLGYPLKVALSVAVALAQIGEFSFILGALGKELGILDDVATNTLVVASIISITLNPLLYRLVIPTEAWIMRHPRWKTWFKPGLSTLQTVTTGKGTGPQVAKRYRAVVVGYGPVGRTLTRLLGENGIATTVIELNLETVRQLRETGINAIYGDSSHRDTLSSAGVADAGTLILSSSGMQHSEEVIRLAREMNPELRVLARTTYVAEIPALRQAGAAQIFSGEGEVALSLIEAVLRPMGATAEQIDRERERFREDVLGSGPLAENPASAEARLSKVIRVLERGDKGK